MTRSLTAPLRTGRFRWCLTAFAVGVVLDVRTTAAVSGQPALHEGNPFVASALASGGLAGILALKLAPVAAVVGLFRLLFDDATYALAVQVLVAACGVAWTLAGLWNAALLA